jgi:hypothetical protein
VRLAFYSADSDMHSGRYFYSSEFTDATARPTLIVTWGDPAAKIDKSVWPAAVEQGQQVTYTLSLLGSGHSLMVTDDLPDGVGVPGSIHVIGGDIVTYDVTARRVAWTGTVASGQPLTITFSVSVEVSSPHAILNTAIVTDAIASNVSRDSAVFIANPYSTYLPAISR